MRARRHSCHNCVCVCVTGIQWAEARDTAKPLQCPTPLHSTTENDPVPEVNSAEAEKTEVRGDEDLRSVYGQESCQGAFHKRRVLNVISWPDLHWIIITCLPKIYTLMFSGYLSSCLNRLSVPVFSTVGQYSMPESVTGKQEVKQLVCEVI